MPTQNETIAGGYDLIEQLGSCCYHYHSWKAQGPEPFPVVIRRASSRIWDDYGGVKDLRADLERVRTDELERVLGAPRSPGLAPLLWLRAEDDGLLLCRPYYANPLIERLPELTPEKLAASLLDLARGLDELAAHLPGVSSRIVANNLFYSEGRAVLTDCGLGGLYRVISRAYVGPVTRDASEISEVFVYTGEVDASTGPVQRAQMELAATYFYLRTGQPLFFKGDEADTATKLVIGAYMGWLEYRRTGHVDLTLLGNTAEQRAMARAVAPVPGERYPSCEEFVTTLAAVA